MGKRKKSTRKSTNALLPSETKQRKLTVKLTFPEAALRSIDLTGRWNGSVSAILTGPTSSRLVKIAHLREAKTIRRRAPSPEVTWLVREWNRRSEPPPYIQPDRNRNFDMKKLHLCRKEIESLTDWYEQARLKGMLKQYFEQCTVGKHIWEDIDHRYKTLSGWVKAVVKAHALNSLCWWEEMPDVEKPLKRGSDYILENDPYPETTKLVADTYAQLVLDREDYGKEDKNWIKFQVAAKKVEDAYEDGDIPARRVVFVKAVVRAAIKMNDDFDGGAVYPGHLTADNLWQVVLPQFLADYLPGARLPRSER